MNSKRSQEPRPYYWRSHQCHSIIDDQTASFSRIGGGRSGGVREAAGWFKIMTIVTGIIALAGLYFYLHS